MVLSTHIVFSRGCQWVDAANRTSPFLGVSLSILLTGLLCHVWSSYKSDVKATGFRLSRHLALSLKVLCEEYLWFDPRNKEELKRRRHKRRFLRMAVFSFMSAQCVLPASGLPLGGYQSMLSSIAVIFAIRICLTVIAQPFEVEHLPFPSLIHKIITGVLCFPYLLYTIYTRTAFFCLNLGFYFLSQPSSEQRLTRLLEKLDFDIFEGLERYYVMGLLGSCEVLATLLVILWSLTLHLQCIALIALYTNVYNGGREFLAETMRAAFTEWSLLAHFDRATSSELKNLNDVCAICLAPMRTARKTVCQHILHGRCLRQWLREKQTCPICVTPIA